MQQDQSLPPPDAPLKKSENVVVSSNLGETKRLAHMACVGVCNPSHCPLPSWCTVVQSNRLNSLSFTSPSFSVSFPRQEFNDFAQSALIPKIVIPGGFLNALTGMYTCGTLIGLCVLIFVCVQSMHVSNFCNHFYVHHNYQLYCK